MKNTSNMEPTVICDIRVNDPEDLNKDDFGGEIYIDGERFLIFNKQLGDHISKKDKEIDELILKNENQRNEPVTLSKLLKDVVFPNLLGVVIGIILWTCLLFLVKMLFL